ncbi:unnamed protein product [Lactuca virosa]|uniref:Peptidylprolyl isomerase n=1 Tax=Lactuca virosa TaxID=75947 RepID=A0AAU9M538_9ASTR|nr:unnamed protein product [Lactuca virosa]
MVDELTTEEGGGFRIEVGSMGYYRHGCNLPVFYPQSLLLTQRLLFDLDLFQRASAASEFSIWSKKAK